MLFLSGVARSSPLSQIQTREITEALTKKQPLFTLRFTYVKSWGDRDLNTSLKAMDKTDFFTKELDAMVIDRKVDFAVHSAKDLPDPLPKELQIVALTASINDEDVLVFPDGQDIHTLPRNPKIGLSSYRREELVKEHLPDAVFMDLRGNIQQRLDQLFSGAFDAIVMAKAALIRLNYHSLSTFTIGKGADLQGSLAVVARKDAATIASIFRILDTRKKKFTLYAGINPENYAVNKPILHIPVIHTFKNIFPKNLLVDLCQKQISHVLITSRTTHRYFLQFFADKWVAFLQKKIVIAIGEATANDIYSTAHITPSIPLEASQEGLMNFIENLPKTARFFYPRSALARTNLSDYLDKNNFYCMHYVAYTTEPNLEAPNLNGRHIDEVIYTSPSVVDAFNRLYPDLFIALNKKFIGHVTENYLTKR